MLKAHTFDTLAFAKKLIAGGFTQQQAETQAETIAEMMIENFATKKDLEQGLKDLEHRLTIRMGAIQAGSIAILVALMKLL